MEKDYTFIDFDGVILDSQERMLERKEKLGLMNHKDRGEFDTYFEYAEEHKEEWAYIIHGAQSINNSVEIIRELEKLNKKIAILTKIHTLHEMKLKVIELRDYRNIYCPIIFVPPGTKKHQLIIPNNQILIDDSKKNINNWIENGGIGYIFDKNIDHDENNKVRSLEFLLKR